MSDCKKKETLIEALGILKGRRNEINGKILAIEMRLWQMNGFEVNIDSEELEELAKDARALFDAGHTNE